jgi:hypothetical protein
MPALEIAWKGAITDKFSRQSQAQSDLLRIMQAPSWKGCNADDSLADD